MSDNQNCNSPGCPIHFGRLSERVGMGYEFEPVRGYYTTVNAPDGSVTATIKHYERSWPRRDKRADAIRDGFRAWGHDDFNIAVWKGDKLVSWDWMEEPITVEDLSELEWQLISGEDRVIR